VPRKMPPSVNTNMMPETVNAFMAHPSHIGEFISVQYR
jgi:hypothetical protein